MPPVLKKNETTCETCMSEVTAEDTEDTHPDAQLTMLKEFKTGCLLRVSDKTLKMMLTVEAMFHEAEDKLMDEKYVKSVLLEWAQELTEDVKFADCHIIQKETSCEVYHIAATFLLQEANRQS